MAWHGQGKAAWSVPISPVPSPGLCPCARSGGAAARSAPRPLPPLKDSKPLGPALSAPQFPVQDTGEQGLGKAGLEGWGSGEAEPYLGPAMLCKGRQPWSWGGALCHSSFAKPLGALSPLVAHSQMFKKQEWAQAGREGGWGLKWLHPTQLIFQVPSSLQTWGHNPCSHQLWHFLGHTPFQTSASAISYTKRVLRAPRSSFPTAVTFSEREEKSLCGYAYDISL